MTEPSDLRALVTKEILAIAPGALDAAARSRLVDSTAEITEEYARLKQREIAAAKADDLAELLLVHELTEDLRLRAEADLARRHIADSRERRAEIIRGLGYAAIRVARAALVA